MSYEVLYDKQFIKVNDNLFCPVALMGSSNCYEVERNRRSRSWGNLTFITGGSILASKEQMEKSIDEERLNRIERNKEQLKQYPDWEVYSDDNYGYWSGVSMYGKSTRGTTFQQYKNFWVGGCKSAQTVETLREHRITVNLHAYIWDTEKFKKETGKEVLCVYPKTSIEFEEEVKNFENYYKDTDASVYVSLEMSDENAARKMRGKLSPKAKKEKQPTTIKEFWVLKNSYGYFVKLIKYGFKYAYQEDSYLCKRVFSEKQAVSLAAKVNARMFTVPEKIFQPCKVEKDITIYK